MAIYTSMTGLAAASTDLSVTSNNIANVGANGFKKSRAQFGDIIGSAALSDPRKAVGLGTANRGISQIFTQGSTQATGNTLDLALTGNGFFVTESSRGEVSYTRNGAFALDTNRYVVDGTGATLQVFPTTAEGVLTASGVGATQPLRIPETAGLPQATSLLDVAVNLPSAGAIPVPAFDRNDPSSYNASTSTTVFDSLGNPLTATLYYRRLTAPTVGLPTSTWEVRSFVGATELSTTPGPVTPVVLTFDGLGNLTAPVGPQAYQVFTPPSGGAPMTIAIDHGTLTSQLADPFTVVTLDQDGFAAGRLDSLAIDSQGLVRAGFTNGETQALGKIAIAEFTNPAGLKQLGDARWTATRAAGNLLLGEAGSQGLGTILSGSIERSNVELTDELVNLIVAQRNFQANAKAVETDQAMVNSIINLR